MKVVGALHPAYIVRGAWSELSLLAHDLAKAQRETETRHVQRHAVTYIEHPTVAQAREVLRPDDPRPLVVDIETTRAGDIWCCGATREPYVAYCFPWTAPFVEMLGDALCAAETVVAHNAGFDFPRLARALGRSLYPRGLGRDFARGRWFDTMAAHALVEPDHPHTLAHLGTMYSDLLPWKDDENDSPETYNCKDVDVTARAQACLVDEMRREGVLELHERVVAPILPVLYEMSETGIKIDRAKQAIVLKEVEEEERGWRGKLDEIVGALPTRGEARSFLLAQADVDDAVAETLDHPGTRREAGKLRTKARKAREAAAKLGTVNPQSPLQVKKLLYDELGLPVQRSYGSVSTDDDALDELLRRTNHPVLQPLRELRELLKLKGTYLAYEEERLHPEFWPSGTGTGRLSSRNPNIQNIPSRGKWAKKIRSMFVPTSKDWEFVEGDYGQIERRIQAWASGDRVLGRAFADGVDVHTQAASLIFGVPMAKVTKEQRDRAKTAVYLESYGGGYLKLARGLAKFGHVVSPAEAKRILAGLSAGYPRLKEWREEQVRIAMATKRLRTAFGRYRWFFADAWGDAMNFVPQATAADVILSKMVALRPQLPGESRLLVQVHDSLLVETPREEHGKVVECLRDTMQSPVGQMGGWSCPVDFKEHGRSWAFEEKR